MDQLYGMPRGHGDRNQRRLHKQKKGRKQSDVESRLKVIRRNREKGERNDFDQAGWCKF